MDWDDPKEDAIPEITTRRGYLLKDVARSFLQALSESGPVASGKVIHFTADLLASGGLALWQKLCWDYTYEHIGVASPRIFLFLSTRFKKMVEIFTKNTIESFCHISEMQQHAAEIVLILQMSPKKTKTKMPTVPPETHENEEWLRSVLRTTDKVAVRKVWQLNVDLEPMLHAGNEMVYAITEGATERALFWVKWLLEEDGLVRKKYGSGLTTVERGPADGKPAQRASVGYYLLFVLTEVYKEFAEKGMMRMHEEFQSLINLYKSTDQKNSQRRKLDTLAIMIQLLTDVPKWKVPAAPSLVTDATSLARMTGQTEMFFKEILQMPMLKKPIPSTLTGLKQKKAKEPSKEALLQKRLEMIDQAAMSYYKM